MKTVNSFWKNVKIKSDGVSFYYVKRKNKEVGFYN